MNVKRVISGAALAATMLFTTTAASCAQGGAAVDDDQVEGELSNDDGGNGLDLSDLSPREAALVNAIVGYSNRCYGGAGQQGLRELLDPGYEPTETSEAGLYGLIFANAFRSPHVTIEDEALEACTAFYSSLDTCDEPEDEAGVAACARMATGSQAEGEACFGYFDCAEGLSCSALTGCGSCVASGALENADPAGLGESCDETSCEAGLEKLQGSDGCTCVVPASVGEACYDTGIGERIAPCDAATFCDPVSGVCEAPRGLGEACAWFGCAEGLYCDGENDVCLELKTGLAVGDACSVSAPDSCGQVFNTGLVCNENTDGTGNCAEVEVAELGESCDHHGVFCRNTYTTAFCDLEGDSGGVCRPAADAGEPCDDRPCNYQARCIYSEQAPRPICEPLPGAGEACLDGGQCEDGLHCGADTVCVTLAEFADDVAEAAEMCWEQVEA